MSGSREVSLSEKIGAVICVVSPLESIFTDLTSDDRILVPRGDDPTGRILRPPETARPAPESRGRRARRVLRRNAPGLVQAAANALQLCGGSEPRGRRGELLRGALSAVSVAAQLANSRNIRLGGDGADQVSIITHALNCLYRLAPDDRLRRYVLSTGALHLASSYFFSGVAKAWGHEWREGTAVPRVLRTRSYGNRRVYGLIAGRPAAGRLATYATLLWEISYPVIYLVPRPAARVLLGVSAFFHLANGPAMGLWRFVFAFGALHPYQAWALDQVERGTDGELREVALKGLAAVGAIYGASLLYSAVNDRLAEREEAAGGREYRARNGMRFRYRVHGAAGAERLVLLENGWGGLAEEWHYVRDFLLAEGLGVVTHDRDVARLVERARRAGLPHEEILDLVARDTAEFLEWVARERGVEDAVVMGHSLGGEIARRAACLGESGRLRSVGLDPTHPDQFVSSPAQAANVPQLEDFVWGVTRPVRWGLSMLMVPPLSFASIPAGLRRRALRKYRSRRHWRNVLREWELIRGAFAGRTSASSIPAAGTARNTVVSAGRGLQAGREMEPLHRELGGAGHVVVPGAAHHSIFSKAKYARQVARIVADLPRRGTEG
ncbi:hypothetical protein NBM05_08920 [Rothia sp. AR01]|uniref:Uncharacterized protein n=1 Tax=Rothia santali TaxID=2949643 RepID=A0A9X2HJM0_9MICC|nr:hypothetical protein [Rothia santali]MCP3426123.1 hypothetical protein [Rothia santali]